MSRATHLRDSLAYFAPWRAFVIYIVLTLLLNLLGPWEYADYDWPAVVAYMLIFMVAATMTYIVAIRNNKRGVQVADRPESSVDSLALTRSAIVVSCFLLGYMIFEQSRARGGSSIEGEFFAQINAAYNDKEFIYTRSYWLYSYLSVVDIAAKCLGVYNFRLLSATHRVGILLNYALTFWYVIYFDGNQKLIGDMFIYLASVLVVKYYRSFGRLKLRHMALLFAGGVGALYLFVRNLSERLSGWQWVPEDVSNRAFANYEHWMIALLPESLRAGGMAAFMYISNGYYGLSLSLRLPFDWSGGLGSSFALREIFTRWFGISEESYGAPYPDRLAEAFGYDGYVNWVSIFPWLASDLTFAGAIVFLCGVVYVYASAWYRCMHGGNWIALLVFAQLNVLLIYVPDNNQLFQTKTSLIATTLLLAVWTILKDRRDPGAPRDRSATPRPVSRRQTKSGTEGLPQQK